ncbi:S-layer homology domain-containing protein [Paenibacillus lutrae]|uniref:S-layer homology domain-containing protein n=1 Tax=Paenibacillus lutrae TaxID=2078573 RepID=A0A7X3FHF2_9BACL|nr:S-layer homology domain-containing protein [Paenibacillus lutrae]MVO99697.1 S-layer homology domain-containing protein [Paenibacillus lutrae]
MNKLNQTAAMLALTALMGGGALLPYQVQAAPLNPAASIQKAVTANDNQQAEQAVQQLISEGVIQGYGSGQLLLDKKVTNAELLKMIVVALGLDPSGTVQQEEGKRNTWYSSYVETAAANGLVDLADEFQPNKPAESSDIAQMIAKALKRDVKSVQYWMEGLNLGTGTITRGETAQLIVLSKKAVRSETAEIVSIQALNAITFEVTFSAPLSLEDETTAEANANFAFDHGLKLVNQPRLKTGSFATYIVPVQTMTAGTTYTTNYKGLKTLSAAASTEKIRLSDIRQVTSDTFEVDSLRTEGVVDYGYLISAYAGGRGANAIILDENNQYNGQKMQVIPSLASRQATLTPEGGAPVTVNYVGFTQSTDGRQEPKFRLPAGTQLVPGVKYSVTGDWFELKNNTFVAQTIQPLTIASVSQLDAATLNVTLSEDPGDELFAYRSVQLKGSDGTMLTAQYKVQTRQGAVGVFELQNHAKLASGVDYEVTPVGGWAAASPISLTAE